MRVEAFLSMSARRWPNKTAIWSLEQKISYGELDQASCHLAGVLAREGVCRGDRVILLFSNRIEAAIAIFACQKAGAVFSALHPSTKPQKLSYVLKDCRARVLMTEDRLMITADRALEQIPSPVTLIAVGDKVSRMAERTLSFEEAVATPCQAPVNQGTSQDLSALIYTSGSTGQAKGVMMTHQSVVMAEQSIAGYLRHNENDIVLSVLPLSSSYGLNQLFLTILTGATLVLEKSFAYPNTVLERLKRFEVTGFPVVPTMAAMILQIKTLKPGDFPHLRYMTNAAAAMPVSHFKKLQALFPDTAIYSMYGQTECKRGTWLPPEHLQSRPGSVGMAIPGTTAYVVDKNGEPLAADEIGELVIQGPHVMKGYWNDESATKKALRPGLSPGEKALYTGDLFYADAEGFLYFVARKDDIIKSRGEKIAPKEIETVLHELDGIAEAVVMSVSDPLLGQAIKALVVPCEQAKLDEREILRYCASRLEEYKIPTHIEFCTELPKSANGKIQRRTIKQPNLEPAS